MKSYYIIAVIVVAAFVVLGAASLKSSMTPYVTSFKEVQASSKDKIQVPGEVVKSKGSTFDQKLGAFVFTIVDEGGREMKVVYRGVKPGNFDQADKVVAIGQYRDGAFQAEQLLVKCPSKYKSRE
jgi:cytochrome c-type biogenesis protein CcmE